MLIWKDVTVWRAIKHIGMKLIASSSKLIIFFTVYYTGEESYRLVRTNLQIPTFSSPLSG